MQILRRCIAVTRVHVNYVNKPHIDINQNMSALFDVHHHQPSVALQGKRHQARPNRSFCEQLMDFEEETLGSRSACLADFFHK